MVDVWHLIRAHRSAMRFFHELMLGWRAGEPILRPIALKVASPELKA